MAGWRAGEDVMRCSGSGTFTCYSALAALIAAALGGAAAQDGTRTWLLTRAYNASDQQLEQFSAAPGNIVFSPYSIGTAMAMALAGARGETEREMVRVLKHRLDRPEIDAVNAMVLSILNSYDRSTTTLPACPEGMRLNAQRCEGALPASGQCVFPARREGALCVAAPRYPPSAKLVVADALMLTGHGAVVSKDYVALLKDKYAAEVFEGAGLEQINGWVARKTEGKIDKILDRLDQSSAAVLINAIYFKAAWASTFRKEDTREDAFHLTSSAAVQVPTMHKRAYYPTVARSGYRAIRLPYAVSDLNMVVVLPNAVDGLADLAARLGTEEAAELFGALLRNGQTRYVDLSLPRFKTAFKTELITPLRQAGMRLPFDPNRADFSGITGRPLSEERLVISQIVHRAVIEVQEEGTEAAAATAIEMSCTSAPPNPEPFRVDRPFLFYILDYATGAILFQGRIVDPRSTT
jgi:serpin B